MKILVVGAGVVGTTAAYYLKADGHEVTVLERGAAAGLETSFANAGQLCRYTARPWAGPSVPSMIIRTLWQRDAPYLIRFRADPAMWGWLTRFLLNCRHREYRDTRSNLMRLSVHSANLMEKLLNEVPLQFDQKSHGVLHLFQDQRTFDHAVEDNGRVMDTDERGEVLSSGGCISAEPALAQSSTGFKGGIFHRHEKTGDAHRFTTHLAAHLETQDVIFRYGVNAQRLIKEGDTVCGLMTDDGPMEADAIVISAANGSVQLLERVCPNLPIYPVKGYSITLDTEGFNGAPTVGIQDHNCKIGFSRLGGRLRVAGTAEFGARDNAPDPRRIETLRTQARKLFPGAGDFETAKAWSGLRPMTPDGAPIIGRTKWKNLFVNTGHGSLGWSLACGSGGIIADLVSERSPAIDLTGLTIERFG